MKYIIILIIAAAIVFLSLNINNMNKNKNINTDTAIFAGGCFWCIETAFESLGGVVKVISGYTGGQVVNPTYEQVSSGTTGHYEAVEVTYNIDKVSYAELVEHFWSNIDPTDDTGQFIDKGSQYRTAIFYKNDEQKEIAMQSKVILESSGNFDAIVTEILPVQEFYIAEDYHQDYSKNSRLQYNLYEKNSGRKDRLEELWGDYEGLKEKLTPLQYEVTQQCGTEAPFDNEYWDNKAAGIYVDIVSGQALFSSLDKYDSGTGWPSFTKPIDMQNVVEKKEDGPLARTEIKSSQAGSHLGHVFPDGPGPEGDRYCINSASLKFIPKEEMVQKGYEEYLYLFE